MDKFEWKGYIQYIENWLKAHRDGTLLSDGPMNFDDWCVNEYTPKEDE